VATLDQKEKRVGAARKRLDDITTRLAKHRKRLSGLEAEFEAVSTDLKARIEEQAREEATARAHLAWIETMPVDGVSEDEEPEDVEPEDVEDEEEEEDLEPEEPALASGTRW